MFGLSVMRTANAGVLLEIDGVSILLDGVCEPLYPYLGTPLEIKNSLKENMPDVLAFTHKHPDHYDLDYEKLYNEKTLRSAFGPESLLFYEVGNGVNVSLIKTRHIGKTDISHVSYVIEGSHSVWFMGDASPLSLNNLKGHTAPDLLIVPFAYAITPSSWRKTKETGAKKILLLHMPLEKDDREGLWKMVKETVCDDELLFTLEIGEKVNL